MSTIETLTEQFAKDGYAIARGMFSEAEVAALRETFMAQNADGPVAGLSDGHFTTASTDDPLAFYPRMMHPHRHPDKLVGPIALDYMMDARLHEPLKAMMDDEPAAVQSMFYFKPAGARGQDLHQDNFYLRVKPGTCCAMWLAVDDADEENGGMVVVPGTHDMEIVCPQESNMSQSFVNHHVPVPEGKQPLPLQLKAGDVLFFNGSVVHGSYPNHSTDRFRRAFICHYVPASSAELSQHYTEPRRFDGTEVEIPMATGGGPCGVEGDMVKGPH